MIVSRPELSRQRESIPMEKDELDDQESLVSGMGAFGPAALPPEAEATGQAVGMRSGLGGLAILVLAAGIMTGVIPIPDLGILPPASGPAAVEQVAPPHAALPMPAPIAPMEAQPQPQALPSAGLLQPLQASELERAIGGMRVAEADKEHLRGEIAAGSTHLAWMVLSDWDAEDGDAVLISAAGYSQLVPLYHRPTTLAVPYKPGIPVTMTAAIDGNGGGWITVAVHIAGAPIRLNLRPGATVQVPTP
jgi:hypothetical protein